MNQLLRAVKARLRLTRPGEVLPPLPLWFKLLLVSVPAFCFYMADHDLRLVAIFAGLLTIFILINHFFDPHRQSATQNQSIQEPKAQNSPGSVSS